MGWDIKPRRTDNKASVLALTNNVWYHACYCSARQGIKCIQTL